MSSAAPISIATVLGARIGRRLGVLLLAASLLAGLWLLLPARASAIESGALSQLPSPANCVGNTEESVGAFCGTGVGGGLQLAYQAAVSPDGANVYSVANGGALIEYSRNLANGALTVIGCITGVTSPPTAPCAPRNGQYGVTVVDSLGAIAISPDGKNVYVLDQDKNMVVELSRNVETGLLSVMEGPDGEPECITEESGLCEHPDAIGLGNPYGITVSPDGENVYVASLASESIAELTRNTSTGTLEEIPGHVCIGGSKSGCPEDAAIGLANAIGVVVSPDGKDVYIAAGAKGEEGDVAAFKRGTGGVLTQLSGEKGCLSEKIAGCTFAKALQGSEAIAISPEDGKDVYATSYLTNAVVELERNASTGVLTQLAAANGCVSTEFTGCTKAVAINGPLGLAASPDGTNLYASGFTSNSEASFARNATTGALEQLGTEDPCVTSESSGCGTDFNGAVGLEGARRVTVSPDGTNVYVAGQNANALVELARTVTPALTEVNPKEGSETGGHQVTIEGRGFREGAQVSFGGMAAASVMVESATRISAITPADAEGPVDVQVTNKAGESPVEPVNGTYKFTTPTTPTVTEVSPNNGAEPADTTVTITGSEFVEPATVRFGGKVVSGVTVNSGDSITATAPPGTGTVDVTVETTNGKSATSPADQFEYHAGGLSLAPYCESLGDDGTGAGATVLMKGGVEGEEFAYNNWACVEGNGTEVPITNAGAPPSMANACEVQYPLASSHGYPSDPNNAFSWSCHLTASPELERERTKATTATSPPPIFTIGPILGRGGPGPPGIPAPTLARTGNVAPVSGHVTVRLLGTSTFVPLASLRQIPFGSVINATNGHVSVTTALPHGGTQTGEFFSGEFVLTQGRDGTVLATLTGGNFSVCPTAKERAHRARVGSYEAFSSSASGKHVVRKLWANAHGKFTTKGNYAAGAVQGTEWLTEDLCEGTLIRVTRDKVLVTNLVTHHHVEVKVGHHSLAKAP